VTWDYLPIGYWSAVETHVSVIVACLPAIRSLQRSIRDRLYPKPATTSSYYDENSKNTIGSSKKSSQKKWSSVGGSRLSGINRTNTDKEDFVRLDEYEMGVGAGVEAVNTNTGRRTPTQSSLESFLSRSFKSEEDVQPLTTTATSTSPPLGGITVETGYSVDTSNRKNAVQSKKGRVEEATEKERFRLRPDL
jgi:hypothetical protein